MKGMGAVAVSFVLAAATAGVHAGVISDATFFPSDPNTVVIKFEKYADGSPVVLGEGLTTTMYYDEYRDPSGVWFEYKPYGFLADMSYRNDAGVDTEAAQSIGGSLQIGFPAPAEKVFAMIFDVPVRAFGFWVVDNNTMAPVPSFTAKNSSGAVLETVTFEGALVDGHVGVADYGFMGIWAAENIARVEISQDGSLFDNLTFSGVPEPASMLLLAAGALVVLRRRWRR